MFGSGSLVLESVVGMSLSEIGGVLGGGGVADQFEFSLTAIEVSVCQEV